MVTKCFTLGFCGVGEMIGFGFKLMNFELHEDRLIMNPFVSFT